MIEKVTIGWVCLIRFACNGHASETGAVKRLWGPYLQKYFPRGFCSSGSEKRVWMAVCQARESARLS